MKRATVVLADDHPPVAEELRRLLDSTFDVVAVVHHGQALVAAATRLSPEVVVTDINMPGMDGMDAAYELLKARPALRVVFVTVHDDPVLARKAASLGAAYVLKPRAGEELVDAVNLLMGGDVAVCTGLKPLVR